MYFVKFHQRRHGLCSRNVRKTNGCNGGGLGRVTCVWLQNAKCKLAVFCLKSQSCSELLKLLSKQQHVHTKVDPAEGTNVLLAFLCLPLVFNQCLEGLIFPKPVAVE